MLRIPIAPFAVSPSTAFYFRSMQLQNYASGQWIAGSGKQRELVDAITGDLIGTTSSGGLDFAHMLHYARTVGGPPLRKMTFPERGRMLKALAQYLFDQLRRSGPQGA
jgi:oxepin-CoA hydrolase/3-oxo-5,6-dehydrosuberyl-CoA semialdehyde dehydrogenase